MSAPPLVEQDGGWRRLGRIGIYALLILFAYGAEALWRVGVNGSSSGVNGVVAQWKSWWARARGFDRRWVTGWWWRSDWWVWCGCYACRPAKHSRSTSSS